MNNRNETYQDNEINLKELFLKIWRGKVYIFLIIFLYIFLASVYLQYAEKKVYCRI